VRLIGGDAEAGFALFFVGLEIAFAPVDVAFAFEGQDVGGDAVEEPAVVADDDDAAGVVDLLAANAFRKLLGLLFWQSSLASSN
jgi:hypothetical protein